jgi:gas vesicle protein
MGKTAAELRQDIEQQRVDISRDVDAIGDRVSPARIVDRRTEAVKSRFRNAKEAVMGSNDPADPNASRSVADRVSDTKDHAADLAHSAVDGVTGVPDRVVSGTRGNPLAAGLVAFGLGLIAATLIPSSEKEEELARQLQPQLEKASGKVGEAGRELVEGLRPELEDAVQEVKQEASDAGQRLTGEAKQAVQETAHAAQAAAPS